MLIRYGIPLLALWLCSSQAFGQNACALALQQARVLTPVLPNYSEKFLQGVVLAHWEAVLQTKRQEMAVAQSTLEGDVILEKQPTVLGEEFRFLCTPLRDQPESSAQLVPKKCTHRPAVEHIHNALVESASKAGLLLDELLEEISRCPEKLETSLGGGLLLAGEELSSPETDANHILRFTTEPIPSPAEIEAIRTIWDRTFGAIAPGIGASRIQNGLFPPGSIEPQEEEGKIKFRDQAGNELASYVDMGGVSGTMIVEIPDDLQHLFPGNNALSLSILRTTGDRFSVKKFEAFIGRELADEVNRVMEIQAINALKPEIKNFLADIVEIEKGLKASLERQKNAHSWRVNVASIIPLFGIRIPFGLAFGAMGFGFGYALETYGGATNVTGLLSSITFLTGLLYARNLVGDVKEVTRQYLLPDEYQKVSEALKRIEDSVLKVKEISGSMAQASIVLQKDGTSGCGAAVLQTSKDLTTRWQTVLDEAIERIAASPRL